MHDKPIDFYPFLSECQQEGDGNESFSSMAKILEARFNILHVKWCCMCRCMEIVLDADSWATQGSVSGACGASAGTPLCVLAHTTAEADVLGTWYLLVLISVTLAMVCASPYIKCGRYKSTLQTGSACAPQSCARYVLSSTSYKWSTPCVTRN